MSICRNSCNWRELCDHGLFRDAVPRTPLSITRRMASHKTVGLSCIIWIAVLVSSEARADLTLSVLGQTETIDFQDYTGAGLAPGGGGGTLNSNDWTFWLSDEAGFSSTNPGDTVGAGEFGRGTSTGGVSNPGYYAFETGGGNRALGVQIGSTGFASAVPSLTVKNETGTVVDHLRVRYDIWVLNDSDNSNYFDLEFSDGSNFIDPVFFESPETADASAIWSKTELEYDLFLPFTVFGGQMIDSLNDGESIQVEWSIGGSFSALNAYDEVAVDNVRITAYSTAIPEPHSVMVLSCLGIVTLVRRRRR